MKKILLALLCFFACDAIAKPQSFPVHVGPAPSGHLLAATAPGGTLTVARQTLTIGPDGTMTVLLLYSNASGNVVSTRALTVAANGSQVTDAFGNVIVTPAPTALMNALTSFLSQVDSTISAGATAGKLNL